MIKRKIPHTKQPQYSAGPSKAFSANIIAAYNAADGYYCQGVNKILTPQGTLSSGVSTKGRVLISEDASSPSIKLSSLSAKQKPAETTVFWQGAITGAGYLVNNPVLSGLIYDTSDANPYLCAAIARKNAAANSIFLMWNDAGTFRSITVANSIEYNVPATYALCVGNGSVLVYKDGVQIGSSSLSSTISYSAASFFGIGSVHSNKINQSCSSRTTCAGYFDGALSAAELRSLTLNPWQVFQPRTQYIPIAVASGFKPHWALTASRSGMIGAR